MFQDLRPAIVSMVLFILLLGLGYPLAMTGIAGALFPKQAGGSLIKTAEGQVIGSALIAQGFAKPEYLHPRPSAAGNGYDPLNSSGSNLGPLDSKLIDRVKGDAKTLKASDGDQPIAPDALTTSGSGLDPDVSPMNAHAQAARIAKARNAPLSEIETVIDDQTRAPLLGFVGQPAVNVLNVNRALDARFPLAHPKAS